MMMTAEVERTKVTCPVCGEPIDEWDEECEECGLFNDHNYKWKEKER